MKKLLLTIALFFFCHLIFAQQDALLRNFKFRNINYRAINFSAGGTGQYAMQEFGIGDNKNTSSSGSLGMDYYRLKSTDRILLTASGGFGTSFSLSKNTNVDRDKSVFISPAVTIKNQWFFKNFFTELGGSASTLYSGGRRTVKDPENDYKSYRLDESYELTLGIGKGRLENVTSMQNALWLNKSLQENDHLASTLSERELNGLGNAIAIANNTRILDARKRTQFILESVDDYFQQHGLINNTDIRYFSSLNDIVFFAFNIPRFSGKELFIRANPSLAAYNTHSTNNPGDSKDEQESKYQSLKITAGISKYIPVNLQHQNNFGAAALVNYVLARTSYRNFVAGNMTSENVSKGDLKQAGINAFYEHAIYPNTRTIINFRLDSQAGYQDFEDSSFFGSADLSGTVSYFISYRTYFNMNLGAIYRNNIYDMGNFVNLIPKSIRFYVSAGVQVSI